MREGMVGEGRVEEGRGLDRHSRVGQGREQQISIE